MLIVVAIGVVLLLAVIGALHQMLLVLQRIDRQVSEDLDLEASRDEPRHRGGAGRRYEVIMLSGEQGPVLQKH